ncbi:DUF6157 family protein [Leucobacter luti]|uniref:DUF6157 family protein n=1 Tax=Leucobacter luti TaxID=340320 RepID=UPI003CFE5533
MTSTNYANTFIRVAPDCPAATGEIPPERAGGPSVARLQFELASERPHELTSDDLLFTVHALRNAVPDADRDAARSAFFAKSQACLRASPLPKRYGWGVHHDAEGRIALVARGTAEYERLAADPELKQLDAMRSSRK